MGPMLVGQREQVELRHGSSDAGQRVDPPELVERGPHDPVARGRLAQIVRDDQGFGSGVADRVGDAGQRPSVARHDRHGGEVAGEADGRRAADAAARPVTIATRLTTGAPRRPPAYRYTGGNWRSCRP